MKVDIINHKQDNKKLFTFLKEAIRRVQGDVEKVKSMKLMEGTKHMKALDLRVRQLECKPKMNADLAGLEATFGNDKDKKLLSSHKKTVSDDIEVRMETLEQTLMKVAEDLE